MESFFDILFFAALAVFFLVRLWGVLGRKDSGEENHLPPLENPFAPKKEKPPEIVVLPGQSREVRSDVLTESGHAINSLAGGLDRLRELDPFFDEKQFLAGAKKAFALIVDSFAHGDLTSAARLLSPAVKASFEAAMVPDPQPSGEKRVASVEDAVLSAIAIENDVARLTVDFTSLQTPQSGQTVEIHDRWIFGRTLSGEDPNWILLATSA